MFQISISSLSEDSLEVSGNQNHGSGKTSHKVHRFFYGTKSYVNQLALFKQIMIV